MDTIKFIVIVLIIVIAIIVLVVLLEKKQLKKHNIVCDNKVIPLTLLDRGARILEPVQSRAIVVARYREDLDWLDRTETKCCNVYIYNKGEQLEYIHPDYNYIKLPNVGVCDHTYLYHIIEHYDNLEDVTIFLPASCTLKRKVEWRENVFLNYDNYHSYFTNVHTHNNLYSNTLDNYKVADPRNRHNEVEKLTRCNIRPYGKWYERNVRDKFSNNIINYGGIFSLSREYIRRYPKSFYQNLISYLDKDRLPEAAHYMERTWYNLFKLDLAIYTYFIGSDDNVANVVHNTPSTIFDCYYISNNRDTLKKAEAKGWITIYVDVTVEDDIIDSNLKGKYFKTLPHKIDKIKNYQWTLFIDTKRYCNIEHVIGTCIQSDKTFNIVPHTNPIKPYLEKEITESFHQDRYRLQKDKILSYVHEQRKIYTHEPNTFFGTSIILRRTNHPKSIEICEKWFEHIQMCGIQCQVALYFITLMYEQHIGAMKRETFIK